MYYKMPDGDVNEETLAAFETETEAVNFFKNLILNFKIKQYTAEELEAELLGFKKKK